jgi:hypothetical protein
MRFLIKLITCYIEFSIIFVQIELAFLILFTGMKLSVNHGGTGEEENEGTGGNREDGGIEEDEEEFVDNNSWLNSLDEYNHDIFAKEQWHIAKDHLGKWHIGLVLEIVNRDESVLLCVDVLVSASLFFRFPLQKAKQYLIEMAEDNEDAIILAEDLQYNIVGVEFHAGDIYDLPDLQLTIKTYWLRIIQRAWKRVYAERMRRLKLRGRIKAQRQFELSGKYGIPLGNGLRGLLIKNPQN